MNLNAVRWAACGCHGRRLVRTMEELEGAVLKTEANIEETDARVELVEDGMGLRGRKVVSSCNERCCASHTPGIATEP